MRVMSAVGEQEAVAADAATVAAFQSGDRAAFEELVRRNGDWVRGVVLGILGARDRAEDVTQTVWLNVWERANELRDVGAWRSWLYRMARNAAIDAGRSVARRRKIDSRLPTESPAEPGRGVSPGEQDAYGDVLSAISALPAIYREPFVLRHVAGWRYQEISDVMNLPVDTVETRLVRARRMLRKALADRVR